MELSVIIVNWNTKDLLRECLASIYGTVKDTSFDVWVVDNASADGSSEMVKADFPQVNLIENSENEGFGRANNSGIAASSGEFVLLLNSDIVLTEGAVDTVKRRMVENSRIGAMGCRLKGHDGLFQENVHFEFPHGPSVAETEVAEGVKEAAWVWAAFLMVRRELIDKIGAFDEDFYFFYEDTDWCWRAREAGWPTAYCPDVSVVHGSRQSAKKLTEEVFNRWLIAAEFVLYRKHHSQASYLLFAKKKFRYYKFRVCLHKFLYSLTRSEWNKTRIEWFSLLADAVFPMLTFEPGMHNREDIKYFWGV